ncbi:MAG: formate-dependent phosphoribosylglycinamide formyltransferase [Chitinophagaceae bacterium]|nr:formate-dependent phosphoribosylglycinamide formyltransferase [Chitinophagaceae bacterium]MBP6476181.1 formate-dependent phosphoribosylglycinamide formyltransferase [Chitinophagaceae bacterium]MBP7107186.1 formate-dependent phosphoribosylglycinamide formyltransferase [Chitinophagaceae bacterium]HQX95695.1 formate-dependent phosphoribosylglycinamide formyltransferase [Chitinophagaceae bacterium]HQZ50044.1 formate-dependent phosphoribosylglycinamide formyltransferase [Chitinophagaceae bacteriu
MHKKILLLGSGELGKELVIALKRLGQTVIAVDSYEGAPAMQVADGFEVIDMLNGNELDAVIAKHNPDLVVPEIEAIRTERFYEYEKQNIQVIPSAKAANFTMNRKLIRDMASKELGIKTANYFYATTFEEFAKAVNEIGLPCVVKPLMSSSGKGQSVLKMVEDQQAVFDYAINNSRGDIKEVIIEEFISFHTEITLLTVTQKNGETLFCPPIGNRQERGDYQESWQPVAISEKDYVDACAMAKKVTTALTGAGLWGVEFFLTNNGVYFSELSPRPHDTGMVTLAGTQNLSEFELHARAILGLPIPEIKLERAGVSAVVLANKSAEQFTISGIEDVLKEMNTDVRIFGKPSIRPYRRMAVALVYDDVNADMDELRKRAKKAADKISIN